MRIAYLDHSYHKKTKSTEFLADILERHGHVVDWFWDESWKGKKPVGWEKLKNYDSVVMFQSYSPIGMQYFSKLHNKITYIPMLDQFGIWQGPLFNLSQFWEPFHGIKILNFSSSLHTSTVSHGIASKYVKYFPPKAYSEPANFDKGLRGFVWLRREDQVNWGTIKKLINGTAFESFHIHVHEDPGTSEIKLPTNDEIQEFNITISTWFENKNELLDIMNSSNVFFCSRVEEGIGQAFLDALSHGKCVVAANQGTMNEYIVDGINGLLYDNFSPVSLDFSKAKQLGQSAWRTCELGRKKWEFCEEDIVNYIISDNSSQYRTHHYKHSYLEFNKPVKRELFGNRVKMLLLKIYRLYKHRRF